MAAFKSIFSRIPKHSKFHYETRYAKEEKGLENRKSKLILEKGAFFKHSKTLSKFRNPSISHYNHNTKSRKRSKYVILLLMMACVYVFYHIGSKIKILGFVLNINAIAGIFALLLLLVLLIIFLRLNNKS